MSINATTFSLFYFNFDVDKSNRFLNFKEGAGPELTASVAVGSHTFTEILTEVKTAMDAVGALVYTVTGDRDTREITISSTSAFDLLISSGTQVGSSVFATIGFTGADLTGLTTYTGNPAGQIYEPQFKLQSFISSEDSQESVNASVNTTANGEVEVIRFGLAKFIEMNIRYGTDLKADGKVIKNNPTGLTDLRTFMQFITTKAPVEFMIDIDTRSTFQKVILESTPSSRQGIGYRLNERYDNNLPGYFDTGPLTFRIQT